jgi:Protein of unknown function (DUF1570)
MSRRAITGLLLCAVAAVCSMGVGRADLIYFRSGGEVQLPATVEDGRIVLAMPDGKIELPREVIKKRVVGYYPRAEWRPRQQDARSKGFEARLAAVWWAIENGLSTEAAAEIRELHTLDPKHAQTARMNEVLDRLAQACSDPDFAGFAKALGVETKIARGPHVLLLHQHAEAEAEERVALLEQVIAGYHLMFAGQGVELYFPRRRLVSAWLAEKKDYLAFLHADGADAFASTRGYFHPTWNAVISFDARSTDEQRSEREKQLARREELRGFAELVEQAPARSRVKVRLADQPARTVSRAEAKALVAKLDADATCQLMLLDLDRRAIDLGTAAHEMIHQLAASTFLLPRHDAFANWLHEGLAAQFEVIRGGRWAGISRAHDLRLPDWRRVREPLRLERLVRDAGFGHGYQRELYAQAWALVYYLRTQHAQQFLTFLDLLRNPRTSEPSSPAPIGDQVFAAFQRAFGSDLDKLERDWRGFMETVHTPLEEHAPAGGPAPKAGPPARRAKAE